MPYLQAEEIKAHRIRFRALGADAMVADLLLGVQRAKIPITSFDCISNTILNKKVGRTNPVSGRRSARRLGSIMLTLQAHQGRSN